MNFMRYHWFDVGMAFAVVVSSSLFFIILPSVSFVLWISLIALFVHQFEEYRYPGYFPGMINHIFASKYLDRYPLNANTALIVNVVIGWGSYTLAAVLGDQALWLGIATMVVSLGNFVAHTFFFNLREKTFYNPGMLTADILFLPIALYFFFLIVRNGTATVSDWIVGIGLGIALNYLGILKAIDWLKDEQTAYIFPKRCVPPHAADD